MNTLQKSSIQTYLNKDSKGYKVFIIGSLLVCLLTLIIISLKLGSSYLNVSDIIETIFYGEESTIASQIIAYVRMPRTLAAILAGSGLAISGLILQSLLNNALASPNIIGVNSGAGLFTALATVFPPANINIMPISSFLGAFLATLIVYLVAKKR